MLFLLAVALTVVVVVVTLLIVVDPEGVVMESRTPSPAESGSGDVYPSAVVDVLPGDAQV